MNSSGGSANVDESRATAKGWRGGRDKGCIEKVSHLHLGEKENK